MPPDTLPGDVNSARTADAQPAGRRRSRRQLREATELLESVAHDRGLLGALTVEERTRLLKAAADVFNPDVVQRRRFTKAKRKEERDASIRADESMLADTGIRVLRDRPVFTTPNVYPPKGFEPEDASTSRSAQRETIEEQHCYVCKQPYRELHPFYDQLCPPCAEFNFAKRSETADLEGRVAVLTGGRVKIGYQAGIKLLRAGAHLIVTTRFPRDSAARYAREADFADWGDRLEIYGLDLRHTPSVEAFCHHLLTTHDRLDYIVNNACQTVRRPPDFYRHMLEAELAAEHTLAPEVQRLLGADDGAAPLRHARRSPARDAGSPRSAPPRRPSSRRCGCCPRSTTTRATSSPRGGSTRTCSRSTSATATRGGSCSPRCRRSSCSRRSSSTPSRRSCSTRG